MTKLPLQEWCSHCGLGVVSFSTRSEYLVLRNILESLKDQKIGLIHSKPIRTISTENALLINVTGHSLTAHSALRHRIKNPEDITIIENPADIHNFLGNLKKLFKKYPEIEWWIWWSPSDLISHGVEDVEIAQCLRIIAKDYSDHRFVSLIARNVHTDRGFAIMEYVSEIHLEATPTENGKMIWKVIKHHDQNMEGVEVEN